MTAVLLLLTGAACGVLGVLASPRRALVLLTGVVVLVPVTLVVPNGVSPLPTFVRVTTAAVGIGLLLRRREVFGTTPVHVAAGLLAVGTLVTGVGLGVPSLSAAATLLAWAGVVEPLVVFVVALACIRAVDDLRHVLRVLAGVALLAALLGVLEHLSGRSLGGFLFSLDPSQDPGSSAGRLEQRAGQTRVRAGQEFALAYAWVLAALLPAVLAAPWRRLRGLVPLAGATLVVLAAYWTFSRSAPVALVVGLAVLALALRDRRVLAVLLAGVAAGAAIALTVPAVDDRFGAAVDQGALDVRAERRPVLLEAAAERPLLGLGLSGISTLGLVAVDQTYLLAYVETGVVGGVLLLGALGCAVIVVGRGVLAPRSAARTACAVALAGGAVLLVAGFAFDALALRGTADLFWLLMAVGVAAADSGRGPLRAGLPRTGLAARTRLVGGAVVLGALAASTWPQHVAVSTAFRTVPAARDAGLYDPIGTGRLLVGTVCAVARVVESSNPGVTVDCRPQEPAAGAGVLRISAASAATATRVLGQVVTATRTGTRVRDLQVDVGPAERGRPTAVRTAPVSLGLIALLLALLVPGRRRTPGPGGPLRRSGAVEEQVDRRRAGASGPEVGVQDEGRPVPSSQRPGADHRSPPVWAVVVATRDRPHLLAGLLDALPSAVEPGTEVVVVDSASRTEETAALCAARGVRCVRLDLPGTSRARNAGIASTTAPLVAFTDDDCLPQPGWTTALTVAFRDAEVGIVTGRVVADRATSAPLSVTTQTEAQRFSAEHLIGHAANAAFRRSALRASGGFDEALGPGTSLPAAEDQDLFARVLRAGWSGVHTPDAVVVHRQWRSRSAALRTSWSYGVGSGGAARRAGTSWRGPVVSDALQPAWRDLRAGYVTGTAAGLLRAGGAAVGTFRARR